MAKVLSIVLCACTIYTLDIPVHTRAASNVPIIPPNSQADTQTFTPQWPSPEAETQSPTPPYRPARTARLLFAGDVMQHMPQVTAARQPDGSFDYSAVFASVARYFASADFVTVNLETTLTESDNYSGYPCFRSPVALAEALSASGVDLCVLANNHCCDAGAQGIRSTTSALSKIGLLHTGVWADSTARRKAHPLVVEIGGIRFAFLNYTELTNGIPTPKGTWVNRIDTASMRRDLHRAEKDADCTVVLLHWGNEYERHPSSVQQALARFLRQNGADIIVGSHPHVIQPIATDSTGVIFYSLGNFVSNQRRRYTDGGLMGRITVVMQYDGTLQFAADAIPVWVDLPDYRILPPEVADTLLAAPAARQAYTLFMQDTRQLLAPQAL